MANFHAEDCGALCRVRSSLHKGFFGGGEGLVSAQLGAGILRDGEFERYVVEERVERSWRCGVCVF